MNSRVKIGYFVSEILNNKDLVEGYEVFNSVPSSTIGLFRTSKSRMKTSKVTSQE